MNNETVSIVIPVRNTEKYIERCIKSVLNQTYKNVDIILVVNDSSDRSAVICRNLESIDPRIKVIETAKGGVSRARNLGIEKACGEYITFIDADDFIHTNFIQRLYNDMIEQKADIVTVGIEKHNIKAMGTERSIKSTKNRKMSSEAYAEAMLLGVKDCDGYICKLYRTSVLSHIRFNETLPFSEDTDLLLRVLRQDLQVYISPFIGYFYSQDTSGITKDTSGDKRLRSLTLSERFIQEASNDKIRSAAQCYYWRNAYYIVSQSNISPKELSKIWSIIKTYRMQVLLNTSSPIKYRLIAATSLLGRFLFIKIVSRLVKSR